MRQQLEYLTVAHRKSRFMAAIEGTALGVAIGLIDVHSSNADWFDAYLVLLVACFVLGLRHGWRSWQAWGPIGWCFYLMHRAAISSGYRPPFVEEDVDKAIMALYVLVPAGVGLAAGAFVRFVIANARWAARFTKCRPVRNGVTNGINDTRLFSESDHSPPRRGHTADDQQVRHRLTVGHAMVVVAMIAVDLAALRALLLHDQFFGFGTVYSERYSEGSFSRLQKGMTRAEVEALVGRPLRIVPWNQDTLPGAEEMWYFSDQPDVTANFYRRWVLFENGKVVTIINDFWID
jgi:hypothetical protein